MRLSLFGHTVTQADGDMDLRQGGEWLGEGGKVNGDNKNNRR